MSRYKKSESFDADSSKVDWKEIWKSVRPILVVWSITVWLLLILIPGVERINNLHDAMTHLPHVFIGLGLIGAIFASYNLKSDGHLLWFLGVLLLLAGWI